MALKKLCSCGAVIDVTQIKCRSCQDKLKDRHRLYDKYRRDKKADAFYKSKEWRVVREQVLIRDHGLCQRCKDNQRITRATLVDHIVPLRIAWHLRAALSNLQSLCTRCHAVKTAEDKRKYKF